MLHKDNRELLGQRKQVRLNLYWKYIKSDVTMLLEKHNGDVRRTTRKYNHTHTAFVKAFDKYFSKQLFKSTDTQELQDPEKISAICVKNLELQIR